MRRGVTEAAGSTVEYSASIITSLLGRGIHGEPVKVIQVPARCGRKRLQRSLEITDRATVPLEATNPPLLSSAYNRHPKESCLPLFMHKIPLAFNLALLRAGSSMAARNAMMAMTTSSSIKVKPRRRRYLPIQRQPALLKKESAVIW